MFGQCFRREPSVDPARMQVFRQHEFVFLGDPAGARGHRDDWVTRALEIHGRLGLEVEAVVANDPFFGRTGKILAASQREEVLKIEIVSPICSTERPTAITSANCHLDHFGDSFDIRTNDGEVAHTACGVWARTNHARPVAHPWTRPHPMAVWSAGRARAMNQQLLPLEAASYLPHSLHSPRRSKVRRDVGGFTPLHGRLPPEQVALVLQNGVSPPYGEIRALHARASGRGRDQDGRNSMSATPTWFGPEEQPLFGWLHLPENGQARAAMVLCPAIGTEEMSAYAGMRILAEQLAAQGILALRFDYRCTGNSAGTSGDPGEILGWLDSVKVAIAYIRSCGVSSVGLVGLRMGGTLAGLAASQDDAVAALVLWDPCVSGKSFLREQQALKAAAIGEPPDEGVKLPVGSVEILGSRLRRQCAGGFGIARPRNPRTTPGADARPSPRQSVRFREGSGRSSRVSTPASRSARQPVSPSSSTWCRTTPSFQLRHWMQSRRGLTGCWGGSRSE